jgi:saccharopine dehydrogenase (NAD+, L-lysine-forming)
VECSRKRIFTDEQYQQAGCRLVPAGSWMDSDQDTVIVGLKELPPAPAILKNPMIHFAHVYKQQTGWQDELRRFSLGGGVLYDIEYLTENSGRRVAAFGFWAGWMGAALALWRYLAIINGEPGPTKNLGSFDSRADIVQQIETLAENTKHRPRAIVVGAKGRSGNGAVDALEIAGCDITQWDLAETADLDRPKLLSHDILVNCVLMTKPGLLLAAKNDLASPDCRLRIISDVSCDPFSSFNPLPVYNAPTSWNCPFLPLGTNGAGEPIELTAIDNLPSLIPKEASEDFSSQFFPRLKRFDRGEEWLAAKAVCDSKVNEI